MSLLYRLRTTKKTMKLPKKIWSKFPNNWSIEMDIKICVSIYKKASASGGLHPLSPTWASPLDPRLPTNVFPWIAYAFPRPQDAKSVLISRRPGFVPHHRQPVAYRRGVMGLEPPLTWQKFFVGILITQNASKYSIFNQKY